MSSYGRALPPVEAFSNASYPELLRLTADRFTDYYGLLSSQSVSQSVGELGPSVQLLLQHNPHYQFDLAVAVGGAIALTLFRTLFCNLLIGVSVRLSSLQHCFAAYLSLYYLSLDHLTPAL